MIECVLKDLIDFSRDGEWGKSEKFDRCIPMAVIRGTDFDKVRDGDITTVPIRYIAAKQAEYKQLHGGEILIECAGGSRGQITGRTIFLKPEMVVSFGIPVTCASFSRFIRFRESDIFDPKYIFWHLQYLYESGHLDQYHTQHTGVSRFQWSTFAENEVLTLPPLPTQKKIASILSAYDDLIENNLKRIKILEEMAQRLYREWFVHFRFPGHENVKMVDSPLGPIPEGWEVVELKDIACVNGLSLSAKDTPDIINYIDISSVSTGIINKIEPISYEAAPGRARRIVRHGDIIWSSVRPNRKSYALILFPENYIIASTGFAVLSPEKTPYTYLYCVVTTEDFTAYLTSNTTGAAYPAVNAKTFEKAQILLPDLATMQFFHDLTEPPLLLKQNYLNRNDILRQTRDFLLPKLISGEVDVEGLEIQDA